MINESLCEIDVGLTWVRGSERVIEKNDSTCGIHHYRGSEHFHWSCVNCFKRSNSNHLETNYLVMSIEIDSYEFFFCVILKVTK